MARVARKHMFSSREQTRYYIVRVLRRYSRMFGFSCKAVFVTDRNTWNCKLPNWKLARGRQDTLFNAIDEIIDRIVAKWTAQLEREMGWEPGDAVTPSLLPIYCYDAFRGDEEAYARRTEPNVPRKDHTRHIVYLDRKLRFVTDNEILSLVKLMEVAKELDPSYDYVIPKVFKDKCFCVSVR